MILTALVTFAIFISHIAVCKCATMRSVWNKETYFNDRFLLSISTADMKTVPPVPKSKERMYLGIFHGKYDNGVQYMAQCTSKEDCDAGIRMICKEGKCSCNSGELFFEWPKFGCFIKARMFDKCEVSGQCMAMNPNTYCNPENGRCTCSPNYFFNGHECSLRYDSANLKAQEVYKAAVVAAACFIVAVVGIFVACIVRRSFCRREQQLQQSESNRNSDIFSISDEIAALRAVDKPPSYEEVLQIERTFYGIPPPEYSGPRNEISSPLPAPASAAPVSASAVSVSFNPTFQSRIGTADTRCNSLSGRPKESTLGSIHLGETSRSDSCLQQAACVSDFITAAEVLPVPSDAENSNQNMPTKASSHIAHYSSTPPPRLHQNKIKYEQGSSSLPSSPYLSTISSHAGSTVMDCSMTSGNELPQQDPITTQPSTSCLYTDSYMSHSDISQTSQEPGPITSVPEYSHSVTVIAYDNLGFESDLYL